MCLKSTFLFSRKAFKKYEILTRKREAELQREAETRRIDLMTDDLSKEPPVDANKSKKEELRKLEKLKIALPSEIKEQKQKRKEITPPANKPSVTKETTPSSATPLPDPMYPVPKLTQDIPPVKKTKSEDENLKLSSDAYNGSKMERYVWAQTSSDLDIRVMVPQATTGKDIKVDIKMDSLKVELLKPQRRVREEHVYIVLYHVYMYCVHVVYNKCSCNCSVQEFACT